MRGTEPTRSLIVLALATALVVLLASPAHANHQAGHECVIDPDGAVNCHWTGGGEVVDPPADPKTPAPPTGRFLRTGIDEQGPCWFVASSPPGLDMSDPGNDPAVIAIITAQPPCQGSELVLEAWEVFRSFPLARPDPSLQPEVGITGLPSYLSTSHPDPITWSGTLPSGVVAEVEAAIEVVAVAWGDGDEGSYPLDSVLPFPEGEATHVYRTKTCTPEYRVENPHGVKCHGSLESYPVTVTFTWAGRFRTGGPWVDLGTLDLSAVVDYDVDEVMGVLEPID